MGMVYCRGCAKEIHESATTCPHCGAVQNNEVPKASGEVPTVILVLGYVFAIFFPIIGGGLGIYTLAKGKVGHGIGIIATAVGFFLLWLIIVISLP